MYELLVGESRIEEAEWFASAIGSSYVEVGASIDGLPRTRAGNEGVWVIVDRLTKIVRFIPVKSARTASKLAELYVKWIVRFHGATKSIVSDRDTLFTSGF